MKALLSSLAVLGVVTVPGPSGQTDDPLAGSWVGEIETPGGGLVTRFELEPDGEGGWRGNADTPVQCVFGLPLTSVELDAEGAVVFAMAHARYEGQLDPGAREIHGHWIQGGARARFDCAWEPAPPRVPEELAGALAGTWEGTLVAGAVELRVVFHLEPGDGRLAGFMKSPDQTPQEFPLTRVDHLGERRVRLAVPSLAAAFEATCSEDGGRLGGAYRQGTMTLPLTVARVDAASTVRRPQTPVPPFPYRALEVEYENAAGGISLAGTLTLPPGEGPFPAALLISGSGAQDRDEMIFEHRPFAVLADHLARRGIACLRVDDRGVGGSSAGPDPANATTADFAGDVRAGVTFLSGRPEVDPRAIGLIGHSEGGVIAPLVAADDDRVAWIVLLAGTGVPGKELLEMQVGALERAAGKSEDEVRETLTTQRALLALVADEELAPAAALERMRAVLEASPALPDDASREETIRTVLAPLDSAWIRWFVRHDPRPVLERVRCPVLALCGTLDLQVPWEPNLAGIRGALERGGNPDFTVRELEGLNHLFQHAETGLVSEYGKIEETFAPDALELVAAWIAERVAGD